MSEFTVEKLGKKTTMSISISSGLKNRIIKAAKKDGVSVSSYIEQLVRFVFDKKTDSGDKL